jgi:hypothetical protein
VATQKRGWYSRYSDKVGLMRALRSRIPLLVIGALLVSAQRDRWPFGTWQRVSNGPVIAPQGEAQRKGRHALSSPRQERHVALGLRNQH